MSGLGDLAHEYAKAEAAARPIADLMREAGFDGLAPDTPIEAVEAALRALGGSLNGADPLRRATVREVAVRRLKDAGFSARLVDAALGMGRADEGGGLQGQAAAVKDPEPWPEPVQGAELLESVRRFVARFVILPAGADRVLAAYVVHSYAPEAGDTATYVVLKSPVPQCGKTRALETLELMCWRPWRTAVVSTAVLFRKLEQHRPTLLLDEAEVVRGKGEAADNVRALLNAGYRAGAFVDRCVGDQFELRRFGVFGPKVFAVIGDLPSTLFDRCVVIEMQRKQRGETVERFRRRRLEPEAADLRRQLRRWAEDHRKQLADAAPPLPEFLNDREQETWEPLLAVGQVAGGGWYESLVDAAGGLTAVRDVDGPGIQLLADLLDVFAQAERLPSAEITKALNGLEGRPWADRNHGKGLTTNGLARLLKPFGVESKNLRIGDAVVKGYRRDQMAEPWARYLRATATATPSATGKPAPALDCSGVAVPGGDIGGSGEETPELDLGTGGGPPDRGDAWEPEP